LAAEVFASVNAALPCGKPPTAPTLHPLPHSGDQRSTSPTPGIGA